MVKNKIKQNKLKSHLEEVKLTTMTNQWFLSEFLLNVGVFVYLGFWLIINGKCLLLKNKKKERERGRKKWNKQE